MYKFMCFQPQKLMCKQFGASDFSATMIDECKKCFPQHNFTNEYVIYYEREETPLILGYLHIVKNTISNSKFFSIFKENSRNIANADPSELTQLTAYQITDWEFDEILRNRRMLEKIFSFLSVALAECNKTVLVWIDCRELEYYPIQNDSNIFPSNTFSSHFTTLFLDK